VLTLDDSITVSLQQDYRERYERYIAEVAGVTFSDSDTAPVSKYFNPCPDPAICQIRESDSCTDSGYNHRSNRNLLVLHKSEIFAILIQSKFSLSNPVRS